MDEDTVKAVRSGHAQQRQRVVNRAVRAFLGQQADQMQAGPTVLDIQNRTQQHRVGCKRAVRYRLVQPHIVLQHHAARADVHVPGLGVAGLACAQSDRCPRSGKLRHAIAPHQCIPGRGRRQVDWVVIILAADAPAVQDHQ